MLVTLKSVTLACALAAGLGVLAALLAAGGGSALAAPPDRAIRIALPVRTLRITGVSWRGVWTIGRPVVVRWAQRRLRGAPVRVVLSQDDGRTWTTLATARAERRVVAVIAAGWRGTALVRLQTADGSVASESRRVHLSPEIIDIADGGEQWFLYADGSVRSTATLLPTDRDLLPGPVPGLEADVTSIAAGRESVLALKSDGTVWLFGSVRVASEFSGDSDVQEPISPARRVEGIERALFVRCNFRQRCAVTEGGTVYSIVTGPRGLFFDEDREAAITPVEEVPELFGVTDLSFGSAHGLALRGDGTVVSFGYNASGQLGDGTRLDHPRPREVPGLVNIAAVEAGVERSMALGADGSVYYWGGTGYDEICSGNEDPNRPQRMEGLSGVTTIECSGNALFALRADGALFAWGCPNNGELGDGPFGGHYDARRILLPPVARFYNDSGTAHAITTRGALYGWGYPFGIAGSFNFQASLLYTTRPIRLFVR